MLEKEIVLECWGWGDGSLDTMLDGHAEDLSLDAHAPHKVQGNINYTCNPGTGGRGTQWRRGFFELAGQPI